MHKLSGFVTAGCLFIGVAGFTFLAGCGASQAEADHAAQKAIETADANAGSPQSLDDLNGIQKTYDNLAMEPGLSTQMQLIVRGRQAQIRLNRITMMVTQLRSDELDVARNVGDIERLAMQINASQASDDTISAYDPASQIAKLQAQKAQIQGSVDHLTWTMPNPTKNDPNGKVTSPTLFAVTRQIERLSGDIQNNQQTTVAERKLSAAKGNESETYLRRAEGEAGQSQVNDSTSAADDRRDAALADSKADVLQFQLQQLQARLDEAKVQETSLQASLNLLDSQIQALQTRGTDISQQIQSQRGAQQALIGTTDQQGGVTITQLAQQLSQRMQDAAASREKINGELTTVIPQFTSVISQCTMLRGKWIADTRENPDDPDVAVWKQAAETLHPAYFGQQLALATETKASVAAAKARIDLMIAQMFDGYSMNPPAGVAGNPIQVPGLTALLDPQKTGVAVPAVLGDIARTDSDQLKQEQADTTKDFEDAIDSYTNSAQLGAIDSGPAADQRRNVSLLGEAEVNRQAAQFAQSIGDSDAAEKYLRAADEAQSQVDPSFHLLATTANPPAPPSSAAPGSAQ